MAVGLERLLSPLRLPFRHSGERREYRPKAVPRQLRTAAMNTHHPADDATTRLAG